jgi:hypothetical protein
MLREYEESYQRVFRAAFDAGVRIAEELPDEEVESLRKYSGVVGLVAEHVAMARDRSAVTKRQAR